MSKVIFSGLVHAFADCQLRAQMATTERDEIELLVKQWFVDQNLAARDFLREIALHVEEREKALRATQEATAAPADNTLSCDLPAAGAA